MNLIKPERLKPNDTITFIAPAGEAEKDKVLNAKNFFESLGYNVKLGKNIFNQFRYMAGTDEERLEDLHYAFSDKETNAIFCVRGGYGCLRLINKIDYELIKNNPKIFCGFSDITILSAMLLKRANLLTFSAPMPSPDFQPDNINEYTINNFIKTLTSNYIEVYPKELKIYVPGNAEGILFGGNLASVQSLCGTDFIPDERFIFFIEDLNEPVYKIDRYLTQLLNICKFRQNISAIAIGDFLDIDNRNELDELFTEIGNRLNIPVTGDYPFSHSSVKTTVPYGANAQIINSKIIVNY